MYVCMETVFSLSVQSFLMQYDVGVFETLLLYCGDVVELIKLGYSGHIGKLCRRQIVPSEIQTRTSKRIMICFFY